MISTTGHTPVALAAESTFQTTVIPILPAPSRGWTLLTLTIPVLPGDILHIQADAKVTNDAGRRRPGQTTYTVGIAYQLWYYNPALPDGPLREESWRAIGTALGENVTPDTHHLVLNITRVLEVNPRWTPGAPIGIALRAAAMSTQVGRNGGKDAITIDKAGQLTVTRWSTPTTPEPPRA